MSTALDVVEEKELKASDLDLDARFTDTGDTTEVTGPDMFLMSWNCNPAKKEKRGNS
ncbi:hypothetical protein [Streptomyces viridochromogenes]|uniref:hypothetical protein n=1 Tax=Streptomyces viridochromogenes TaxID=1938 RepID=UPI0002DDEB31|nr:hypothetical protein [Streptomyces viridochromogenes]